MPILAAVLVNCLLKTVTMDLVVPLTLRRPVSRSWHESLLANGSSALMSAGIAIGLVEIVHHRAWNILPIAAPLCLAYHAYRAQARWFHIDDGRRRAIASLDLPMSIVNSASR